MSMDCLRGPTPRVRDPIVIDLPPRGRKDWGDVRSNESGCGGK
ncbi:23086_t:CDS:2 [Cetraspora pellucida]|uniref:23086_t:CDS:1 n=1 Tax=Cetraspora pellucida TaxID=1433469 RepID=A0A9N9AFF0_9GLOM|nr:23086_t:CDS:2 [Cetraspora pellucida]